MRTGAWLAVLALGGIFAFAVTTNTSVFNFHIAGYVVMAIAILGLSIPRRGRNWLGRRRYVRRTRRLPGGQVVEETRPSPYLVRKPAARNASVGMPSLTPDPRVAARVRTPAMQAAAQRSRDKQEGNRKEDEQAPRDEEVIEDVYEE